MSNSFLDTLVIKTRNAVKNAYFLTDPSDLMKTQLKSNWDRAFIVIICMANKATWDTEDFPGNRTNIKKGSWILWKILLMPRTWDTFLCKRKSVKPKRQRNISLWQSTKIWTVCSTNFNTYSYI